MRNRSRDRRRGRGRRASSSQAPQAFASAQATPLYSEPHYAQTLYLAQSPAMSPFYYSPSAWQNQGMLLSPEQQYYLSIYQQGGYPMPTTAAAFTAPMPWAYGLQNQNYFHVLGERGIVAQDPGFGQRPVMPQYYNNPISWQNQVLLQRPPQRQGNVSASLASRPPVGLQQPQEQLPDFSVFNARAIHGPRTSPQQPQEPQTDLSVYDVRTGLQQPQEEQPEFSIYDARAIYGSIMGPQQLPEAYDAELLTYIMGPHPLPSHFSTHNTEAFCRFMMVLQQTAPDPRDLVVYDATAMHRSGTAAALPAPRIEENASEGVDSSPTNPMSDALSATGPKLVDIDAQEKAKQRKMRRNRAKKKRQAIRKQMKGVVKEQERLRLELQQLRHELKRLSDEVKNLTLRQGLV